MIIAGPSMTGKSTMMLEMVRNRRLLFSTEFHRIMYCIPAETEHQKRDFFNELRKEFPQMELILGLPKESNVLDNKLPKLIIIGKNFIQFKA